MAHDHGAPGRARDHAGANTKMPGWALPPAPAFNSLALLSDATRRSRRNARRPFRRHTGPRSDRSVMRSSFVHATMLLIAGACAGSAANAQSALSDVRRLSPEEKEQILANSSEAAADAALMSAMGGGGRDSRPNQIHGEVGAMIGTGNAYGIYGTAIVPLGDNGSAILSFSKSQFGDVRQPRR